MGTTSSKDPTEKYISLVETLNNKKKGSNAYKKAKAAVDEHYKKHGDEIASGLAEKTKPEKVEETVKEAENNVKKGIATSSLSQDSSTTVLSTAHKGIWNEYEYDDVRGQNAYIPMHMHLNHGYDHYNYGARNALSGAHDNYALFLLPMVVFVFMFICFICFIWSIMMATGCYFFGKNSRDSDGVKYEVIEHA